MTTVISWDALTCWCLTHSKMSIYFGEKKTNQTKTNQSQTKSHRYIPLLGTLPLGTGMCVTSASVALPQPQLLAGALPVARTQKFMDRLCLLNT